MNTPDNLLRFWAKTSDNLDSQPNAFHPLICHMIDVAAVAQAMWENVLPEITKERMAKPFGLESDLDTAGRVIAFVIGLHDLGKCSPPFQLRGKYKNFEKNQTRRLFDLYAEDCDCESFENTSTVPHGFVTATELPEILQNEYCFSQELSASIAQIIGGHHGVFADTSKIQTIKRLKESSVGGRTWKQSRLELTRELAFALKADSKLTFGSAKKIDNATAMIFAGLTTVADWIGSNTNHRDQKLFISEITDSTRLSKVGLDLDVYLAKSRILVADALRIMGWSRWPKEKKENPRSFEEIFPALAGKMNHLQHAAVKIAEKEITETPGIFIVEAPMGLGKTEAAIYLAEYSNSILGTRGIFFALPTQATSDQMFGRVDDYLKKKFEKLPDLDVHLMLRHGHASISEEFEDRINAFDALRGISDDTEPDAEKREHANVVAGEWFTSRKRGLLVPFGVGTIDQILLAALQTKHVFVRLFGLANKVVIIDEVHAYDAYMSTLLERLLEWLAALGSPVILLSATLPKERRDALMTAYLKGTEKTVKVEQLSSNYEDRYPRISYADGSMQESEFKIRQIESSDGDRRTLNIEWLEGGEAIEVMLATRRSKLPRVRVKKASAAKTTRNQKPLSGQKPRVCVDLDGVLAKYEGWQGMDIIGPPLPGALEFVKSLAEISDIIIFTSRCSLDQGGDGINSHLSTGQIRVRVVEWLEKHKIPYTDVYTGQGKPRASAFIDDRAVSCDPQNDPGAFTSALDNTRQVLNRR